jgi:hypothetical protein
MVRVPQKVRVPPRVMVPPKVKLSPRVRVLLRVRVPLRVPLRVRVGYQPIERVPPRVSVPLSSFNSICMSEILATSSQKFKLFLRNKTMSAWFNLQPANLVYRQFPGIERSRKKKEKTLFSNSENFQRGGNKNLSWNSQTSFLRKILQSLFNKSCLTFSSITTS